MPYNLVSIETAVKCATCKAENPGDAKFCEECGARLIRTCSACGAETSPNAKFCKECGHSVAEVATPPPVDLSFEEKLDKMQRYLPDGLTEKILAQRGKIEGERKQITVMFCDAVGFTSLSERLGPEKVYSIMDEVFETLIHKVHEYGGTVNKMTGDGIMALFGAPIALEDAPQRAIRSALAIQREISILSDSKKEETGNQPIRMRIGIHTGPVVVGSLGNDLRVEFTAMGDTVNLASRMEGLADPGAVYVTEDTFKLTEGLFRFEALGEKEVKGREAPAKAYRVIAPSTRRSRFDVSAERGLTPFLGRDRELELLLDGLDRAKSGRGQAVSIMGEAGAGKSRLLYEFRKAIGNQDVLFVEGKCLSYRTNVAYHPIIDLLKSTFDVQESDADSLIRDRVKRGLRGVGIDEASALPFVLELLSVKDSGIEALGLTPEARKARTLEALRAIVLKGSEVRPLVLVVEDLHWADNSSEETLKSFLEAISGAQVLLIFTYRPEFVHTWGGRSYHSQINLMRLSNRETLAMAAHILATEHIDTTLEELILEKTEGIPFFVEEFLKSLKDLEMIQWRESGYCLAKDVKDLTIPSTIQDVIMARVDSLPDAAKNLLQTGSAIGREFSCELIKKVMGMQGGQLTPHLSALRDSELLYERGIFPQATYIFRHSLTQEVAYDSLLQKRKQEMHNRIAQAIEELYADRLEEFYEILAYHYSSSENHEKAYQYLKLSGDKARSDYSNREAFRLYRDAIEVLHKLPDNDETRTRGIEVRLAMETPMRMLAYPEDSLQILQEGEKLSQQVDDQRSLAVFCGGLGFYHIFAGDMVLGREYAEKAFKAAETIQDVQSMAVIGFDLCMAYFTAGEIVKLSDLAERITVSLERTHSERDLYGGPLNLNFYSALSAYRGMALAELGEFEQGEALCEKGLRFAHEIGDRIGTCLAELFYGSSFLDKGDGENAIGHLKKCMTYSDEIQLLAMSGLISTMSGWAHYYLGEMERALELIEKGLDIDCRMGVSLFMSRHYFCSGIVHLEMGDIERAQNCIDSAIRTAKDNEEKTIEGLSSIWMGRVLAKANPLSYGAAEDFLTRGIDILHEARIRPWCDVGHLFYGELCADTGQTEKAIEILKKAEAGFKDMGMDYWRRRTQGVVERVQV